MAVTARKNDIYEYAPTRVYSYSRSATAAAEPVRKESVPKTEEKVQQRRKTSAKVQAKPQIKKAVLSIATAAIIASTLIFVMARYAAINSSYSALNDLKAEIVAAEREIEVLNVKLNTSISLEAAREAALNAGMGYPTEEQIVNLNEAGGSGN